VVNYMSITKVNGVRKRRQIASLSGKTGHPGGQSLLVSSSGGTSGLNSAPLDCIPVLAEFELAFNALDGDSEADNLG